MELTAAQSKLECYSAGRSILSATDSLPRQQADQIRLFCAALVDEVARGPAPDAPKASAPAALPSGPLIEELNLLHPRGKHSLSVAGTGNRDLLFRSAKGEVAVPVSAIQAVVILDNIPTDTKGKVLMVLALSKAAGVLHGKTKLESVILQWSAADATAQLDLPSPTDPAGRLQGIGVVVLAQLLGQLGVAPALFHSPNPDHYTSAKGGPALAANVKANPGWLFPLATAFAFVGPPHAFIAHADIAQVELARANGISSTFDLQLRTKDGSTPVEFGQMDRSELGRFQTYLECSRLPMEAAAPGGSAAPGAGKGAASGAGAGPSSSGAAAASPMMGRGVIGPEDYEDDDESDEDDEDFDPNAASDEDVEAQQPRAAKRQRAAAAAGGDGAGPSRAAAVAHGADDEEDEDEDDADFDMDGSDSGGSEGSDDSEEDEDEEGSDGVELVEEEGLDIPPELIRRSMQEEKRASGSSRRGRQQGAGAASAAGGASGSGS